MEKIKLINKSQGPLLIAIEPIGNIFEIPIKEDVEVLINEQTLPLELIFGEYNGMNILSIWPNKGETDVIYNGRKL